VIGTSQDYFTYYSYHKNRFLKFSGGRQFEDLFDVVIGANVARELGYSLGDEIILAHGMGNVSLAEHKNLPFVVSGILEPTASPVDNSLFVSLAGLEAVHIGWEHGVASKTDITTEDINKDDPRLQVKSITAFFL
jgi:putative ABC transport system permease protein